MPSPSLDVIQRGDPVTVAYGVHGALNARAGFLVEDASELPEEIGDYVEKLVAPYFSAAVDWYETIGIGVTGRRACGAPCTIASATRSSASRSTPAISSTSTNGCIRRSLRARRSRSPPGMALQVDIIPATGTPYFTSNIEDGIALADEALREEIAARYPEAWARIGARRAFMTEMLGIQAEARSAALLQHPGFPAAVLAGARQGDGRRHPLTFSDFRIGPNRQ